MTERKISEFFTPRSLKRHRSSSSPDLILDNNPDKRDRLTFDMEDQAVSSLTMGQLLEGLSDNMSRLLDLKLANLVTKQDLTLLSSQVNNLAQDCSDMRQDISTLKAQQARLVTRLNDLESRSRRNNLLFKGLKWSGKPDFRQLVRDFCIDKFGITDRVWINRAHPLGRDGKTIIAHIPDDYDFEYILSRTRELKGTGFVVHRDYTWDVRDKRAHLAAVRTEIERVCGRRKMPIIHDHLVVENSRFTWEEGRLMAGKQDGAQKLLHILGRDFKDFLVNLAQNRPTGSPIRRTDERTTYAEVTAAATTQGEHIVSAVRGEGVPDISPTLSQGRPAATSPDTGA